MYKKVFIKSWKDLKNNPILFIPDIIIFLMNVILGFLFLKYSGLFKILTDPNTLVEGLETAVPLLKMFFQENMIRVIANLIFFALTSFIIGSSLTAMKFGMIKDMIKKRKLTLKKMIHNGKYVWQIISMKIIMFIIGVITFLFILGSGIILYTFLNKSVALIILAVSFPIIILILQVLLFFRYPVMFLENKNPIKSVKGSFDYFLNNKKHVLIIWLIIIAVSLIISLISPYLGFAEQKIALSLTMVLGYFISRIIKIAVNLWSETFKFRSYKLKY